MGCVCCDFSRSICPTLFDLHVRIEEYVFPFHPCHFGQDRKLVERISVARVQPRTSKGITDLLLPQTSLR